VPQVLPTFAELWGIPPALTVAQVLLIDIGTDIWTAIAYATQPAEAKLMARPPRHPQLEKMVNWKVLVYSYFYMGTCLQAVCCWFMFFYVNHRSADGVTGPLGLMKQIKEGKDEITQDQEVKIVGVGKTIYYWTLVMAQIAAAISTTTKVQSVFGFFQCPAYCFPNMLLNVCFVLEVLLGVAAIYMPLLQGWFDTCALTQKELLTPAVVLVYICFVEEVRKLIVRQFFDSPKEDDDSGSEAEEGSGSDSSSESGSEEGGVIRPLLC